MKLSHAIEVFLLSKEIAGFSPNTLRNYRLTLGHLSDFLVSKSPRLYTVTADVSRGFLYRVQITPPETNLYWRQDIERVLSILEKAPSDDHLEALIGFGLGWLEVLDAAGSGRRRNWMVQGGQVIAGSLVASW